MSDELSFLPPEPEDPGSPQAILLALARAVPPESIDELWIFPARRLGPGQSTVVVASAFEPREPAAEEEEPATEDDDVASDRRRILTARFTLARNAKNQPELRQEVAEQGAAPAERVGRVIDGVFRRLDDESEPPRHARISGSAQLWAELLAALSARE